MTDVTEELPTFYLWIDFETNGNPFHDESRHTSPYQVAYPLEVAFVITDNELNNITDGVEKDRTFFHSYIHIPEEIFDPIRDNAPPVVRKMHDDNGLWEALRNVSASYTVFDVDSNMMKCIYETLGNYVPDDAPFIYPDLVLAGSGVSHYDFRYLETYFPKVWSALKGYSDESKPSVDVGVVRRFIKAFTNLDPYVPPVEPQHRAVSDVFQFINEAQYYREQMWDFNLDKLPNS